MARTKERKRGAGLEANPPEAMKHFICQCRHSQKMALQKSSKAPGIFYTDPHKAYICRDMAISPMPICSVDAFGDANHAEDPVFLPLAVARRSALQLVREALDE